MMRRLPPSSFDWGRLGVVHHLTTRRSHRRFHIVLYIFFSPLECGMVVGWEGKERKENHHNTPMLRVKVV
jgi:hypothetical protein